ASQIEFHRKKILEAEARQRFDQLKEQGIISSLESKDFATLCLGMAKSKLAKGFSLIVEGKDEESRRVAASEVTRYAMEVGTLEASKEIQKLPSGILKDEAVAEMVIYLARGGSEAEAKPWL